MVLGMSHSGVIKKQERKEMRPGLGTGVHAQWTPHPVGCHCSPLSLGSGCSPTNGSPSPALLAAWPSSSQCLPSRVQPLTTLPFVLIPALSGSHPHPTASLGALRRIRESVLSSGQTQLGARPHKA